MVESESFEMKETKDFVGVNTKGIILSKTKVIIILLVVSIAFVAVILGLSLGLTGTSNTEENCETNAQGILNECEQLVCSNNSALLSKLSIKQVFVII